MKKLSIHIRIYIIIILSTLLMSCVSEDENKTVIGNGVNCDYSITIPAFLTKSIKSDMAPDASLQYQHVMKDLLVMVIDESKAELYNVIDDGQLNYSKNIKGVFQLSKDHLGDLYKNANIELKTNINGMSAILTNSYANIEGVDLYAKLGFYEGKDTYYQVIVATSKHNEAKYKTIMKEILHSLLEKNIYKTKFTTYYSADSLFAISVPETYTLADDTISNIGINLKNKDNDGGIWILKDWNMLPKDFKNMVDESMREYYSAYNCDLITQSDSFVHYIMSDDTSSYNKYYMRKDVMRNDYIIYASGVSLVKETALKILASVKEYDLKEYTNKYQVKDGFNYYSELGLAIDSDYKLEQNNFHIDIAEQALGNKVHVLGSYLHTRDEDDPNKFSIYNITVMENRNSLDDYALNLKQSSMDYKMTKWNDIDAVEYSFLSPMGNNVYVPTKAIYLIHNKKSYMFQVISLTDVDKKHKELLNSIIIFN